MILIGSSLLPNFFFLCKTVFAWFILQLNSFFTSVIIGDFTVRIREFLYIFNNLIIYGHMGLGASLYVANHLASPIFMEHSIPIISPILFNTASRSSLSGNQHSTIEHIYPSNMYLHTCINLFSHFTQCILHVCIQDNRRQRPINILFV